MANSDKKELAKQLYLHTDKHLKDIAKMVKVSEKTLAGKSGWIKKFKWDQLKAAQTTTKDELIRNTYQQLLDIHNTAKEEKRNISSKESDQIYKLGAFIKVLEKEIDLGVIIQVLREFELYVLKVDEGFVTQVNEYTTLFIHSRIDV